MRITVLDRGGLSVYGGTYDAHRHEAVALVRDDTETVPVSIEFASAPTSASVTTSGLTASAITTSGSQLSLTISGMQDWSRADILATSGGQVRKIRIRARSRVATDRYSFGPERL